MDGLHQGFYCADEFIQLLFADHEGWRSFQDHEIVAADLRKDFLFLEKSHDQHLAKHAFMHLAKRLKRNPELELAWRTEHNAVQHSQSAYFLHHLESSQCIREPFT